MTRHTRQYLVHVTCRCGRTDLVKYTHSWDDPLIRRLAVAKAGWMAEAGTGRLLCPKCCDGQTA